MATVEIESGESPLMENAEAEVSESSPGHDRVTEQTDASALDAASEDDSADQEEEQDEEQEEAPLPLSAQIASLLFVSTRPLSLESLAELTRSDAESVDAALTALREELTEERFGFTLEEVGGSYQLRTTARSARVIHRLIPPRARRLSRAAAETLAVIAYKQPVQRAEIESIRGVDALPTLRTLLDARLIRIVGRESSPGMPALYGTTSVFLEKFGLRDLSELPTVRELMELAKDPGETETSDAETVVEETPDDDALQGSSEESSYANAVEQ